MLPDADCNITKNQSNLVKSVSGYSTNIFLVDEHCAKECLDLLPYEVGGCDTGIGKHYVMQVLRNGTLFITSAPRSDELFPR